MMRRAVMVALAAALAAGCAGKRRGAPDELTLRSLEDRSVTIERDANIAGGREKAIAGYAEFVRTAPGDPRRPEALRRLGDLELQGSEERALGGDAPGKGAPAQADYRSAIRLYQDLLRAYPNYSGNDRVLYQLAKAQEQSGDLDGALASLNRLVTSYPNTPHRDEAQFRRGEILFTVQDYRGAEQAYSTIIQTGTGSPYFERALYMRGWSQFKQGQHEEALHSFFAVLDRRLIGRELGSATEDIPSLSRAEKELVDDTLRVTSLCFANLNGAESMPPYFAQGRRRDYEFRVYRELGDLYLKQDRIKDAADTYSAFARRYPTHPQAPLVQVRAIDAYQGAEFATLALNTKKEFVTRYGVSSEYRRVNTPADYARVQPYVQKHLDELARHYHAVAQRTKAPAGKPQAAESVAAYQEAARWYRVYLDSFPQDPQAAQMNFLLAEALYESHDYAQAAAEYERTAYDYPAHAKSAEAGYSALLAYAALDRQSTGVNKTAVQQKLTGSALRFADTFPQDRRVPAVLTDAAEKLYALRAGDQAQAVANRVLALQPEAPAAMRRTAYTVVAHVEFERGNYSRAELAYQQVLALTPDKDPLRPALVERLAASVYKQGEQLRTAGDTRGAVAMFQRVGQVAPSSPIRATADYDAAAGLLALKDWSGASRALEQFRRSYPNHPLQGEVDRKLAASYLEGGQYAKAAVEFERLAATSKEPAVQREVMWQAAELHEKSGNAKSAQATYQRYVQQYPSPLEPAIEARQRLATLAAKQGQAAEQMKWLKEIVRADQAGGKARTERTRFLAASAAMQIAEPSYEAYRKVALVEPLKKSLKTKKERMQGAIDAYTLAADYGVAEVTTASTYRIAEIYNDFSRALLASQRPKGLKADELEQYNVMLEEQAFPFEEKAIEIHEVNARRTTQGVYDKWVKQSFTALGKLRPVRYAKAERSEGVIHGIR